MHVQYLQNVVFNFEIGLNSQNLSSSQNPLQQNFPFPPNESLKTMNQNSIYGHFGPKFVPQLEMVIILKLT